MKNRKFNEDKNIIFWHVWIFVVFTFAFFVTSFMLSKKLIESSAQERYSTMSECFSFTINYIFDDLGVKARYMYQSVKDDFTRKNVEESYKLLVKSDPSIIGIVAFDETHNVVYATSKELLDQSRSILSLIKPEEKIKKTIFSQKSKPIAVVLYKDKYILMLYQDVSSIMKSAEENLGGKFKLVSEKDLDDVILSKLSSLKVGDFAIFKDGSFMNVYYYACESIDGNSYYINWKEKRNLTPIILKILAVVLGLSAPMFIALVILFNMGRRKIYNSFVKPMNRMLSILEEMAFTTSTSSEELAASSEELAASTRELESKGRILSDLSREMLDDVEQTHDFSKEVASFSEFLIKSLKEFERVTSELAGAIQEIYAMGSFIQQIGERIVVLSINASIESSRETIDRQAIKTLAEEIGNLSETTTKRVSEIFTALENSQEKIDELTDAFMNISKETKKLNEGSVKLFEMIERNKKNSEEIAEAVQGIFAVIEEVNLASQNLAEAATELSKKAYEVQRIVEDIEGKGRKLKEKELGRNKEKEGEKDV